VISNKEIPAERRKYDGSKETPQEQARPREEASGEKPAQDIHP
jgi:hypothetical protein